MSAMQPRITPYSSALGALVSGVDLAKPLERRELRHHPPGLRRPWRDLLPRPAAHARAAPRLRAALGADRRQPLLQGGRRLSGDRRGAQGARPEDQHRRRLAHRPQLRPGAGDGLDAAGARGAAARRRHAVRQHGAGLRGAVAGPAPDARRLEGGALHRPCVRRAGRLCQGGRPGRAHRQCGCGDAGRGAPGGDPPPRHRPARCT